MCAGLFFSLAEHLAVSCENNALVLFPLSDLSLLLLPCFLNLFLFPCIVCLMGSLMSVAFPFLKCTEQKAELGFLPGQFPSAALLYSLLPSFPFATRLKFAEPERGGKRYEKSSNLPPHCFRKSLLPSCSLKETKSSKRCQGAPPICTKPKALSTQCMTESNYRDNYCYLHCPTVVLCNQNYIGRCESEPAGTQGSY